MGTNTLYILRAIGSLFFRFMAQPPIYSFQGSDMFILSRTVVRVKAIHPHPISSDGVFSQVIYKEGRYNENEY